MLQSGSSISRVVFSLWHDGNPCGLPFLFFRAIHKRELKQEYYYADNMEGWKIAGD